MVKKGNWYRVIKYIAILYILSLCIYYIIYKNYIPKSVEEGEFPLKLVWSTNLSDNVQDIFISDNNHILARSSYSVNLISAESGELLWKHIFDKRISSITSIDAVIYVVSEEAWYALDDKTGEIIWGEKINYPIRGGIIREVSNEYIVVNVVSTSVDIYNIKSHSLAWSAPTGRGYQSACIFDDSLYVFDKNIRSYELVSGKSLWNDNSISTTEYVACENGVAYFSYSDSNLIAYDLIAKSKLWELHLDSADSYGLANFRIEVEEAYLLAYGLNKVYVIDKNKGNIIRVLDEEKQPVNAELIGDHLFVLQGFDRTIYSYNKSSWDNSGILRISPPTPLLVGEQELRQTNNMLLFWNSRSLFAYK